MARKVMLWALLAGTAAMMAACASTGQPRPRPAEPETRTLQHIEVDGSVRVRGGTYRGL